MVFLTPISRICLFCLGLIACVGNTNAQVPPFSIPMDLSAARGVERLSLKIESPATYTVDIRFFGKDGSPAEMERMYKALGGAQLDPNGTWNEVGVPATYRVRIFRRGVGKPVLDEQLSHPKTNAAYRSRYATLVAPRLEIGEYQVELNYLNDSSEVLPLSARISVNFLHHGK